MSDTLSALERFAAGADLRDEDFETLGLNKTLAATLGAFHLSSLYSIAAERYRASLGEKETPLKAIVKELVGVEGNKRSITYALKKRAEGHCLVQKAGELQSFAPTDLARLNSLQIGEVEGLMNEVNNTESGVGFELPEALDDLERCKIVIDVMLRCGAESIKPSERVKRKVSLQSPTLDESKRLFGTKSEGSEASLLQTSLCLYRRAGTDRALRCFIQRAALELQSSREGLRLYRRCIKTNREWFSSLQTEFDQRMKFSNALAEVNSKNSIEALDPHDSCSVLLEDTAGAKQALKQLQDTAKKNIFGLSPFEKGPTLSEMVADMCCPPIVTAKHRAVANGSSLGSPIQLAQLGNAKEAHWANFVRGKGLTISLPLALQLLFAGLQHDVEGFLTRLGVPSDPSPMASDGELSIFPLYLTGMEEPEMQEKLKELLAAPISGVQTEAGHFLGRRMRTVLTHRYDFNTETWEHKVRRFPQSEPPSQPNQKASYDRYQQWVKCFEAGCCTDFSCYDGMKADDFLWTNDWVHPGDEAMHQLMHNFWFNSGCLCKDSKKQILLTDSENRANRGVPRAIKELLIGKWKPLSNAKGAVGTDYQGNNFKLLTSSVVSQTRGKRPRDPQSRANLALEMDCGIGSCKRQISGNGWVPAGNACPSELLHNFVWAFASQNPVYGANFKNYNDCTDEDKKCVFARALYACRVALSSEKQQKQDEFRAPRGNYCISLGLVRFASYSHYFAMVSYPTKTGDRARVVRLPKGPAHILTALPAHDDVSFYMVDSLRKWLNSSHPDWASNTQDSTQGKDLGDQWNDQASVVGSNCFTPIISQCKTTLINLPSSDPNCAAMHYLHTLPVIARLSDFGTKFDLRAKWLSTALASSKYRVMEIGREWSTRKSSSDGTTQDQFILTSCDGGSSGRPSGDNEQSPQDCCLFKQASEERIVLVESCI